MSLRASHVLPINNKPFGSITSGFKQNYRDVTFPEKSLAPIEDILSFCGARFADCVNQFFTSTRHGRGLQGFHWSIGRGFH
jgi:hypothetical protein